MFIDASALVAILTGEEDAGRLADKLAKAQERAVSAVVLFEAAAAVVRKTGLAPQEAMAFVDRFLHETGARVVEIDAAVGKEAVAAFARYGKGRHPAALNMGDCFSLACARVYGMPLLCKGDDFPKTDLDLA